MTTQVSSLGIQQPHTWGGQAPYTYRISILCGSGLAEPQLYYMVETFGEDDEFGAGAGGFEDFGAGGGEVGGFVCAGAELD